jgi:hypothetical protein
MNDKKAKRLRRGARVVAKRLGVPKVRHIVNTRTGVVRVAPQSERGIYIGLKRAAK